MNQSILSLKEQAFQAYAKKDFKTASECFEKCIGELDQQKDLLTAAEMRNNLSVVLLELKQNEKALEILAGTDQIFASAGDLKRQAMALGNKATAQQSLGNYEIALGLFEESAELFKSIHEKELRSITLKKIADLQLKTGKQFQALASLDAAFNQKEKKSFKDRILQGFLGDLIKKITHKT